MISPQSDQPSTPFLTPPAPLHQLTAFPLSQGDPPQQLQPTCPRYTACRLAVAMLLRMSTLLLWGSAACLCPFIPSQAATQLRLQVSQVLEHTKSASQPSCCSNPLTALFIATTARDFLDLL